MTDPEGQQGDVPSSRVVEQRVRNRIIEYLELAASFAEQRAYERRAPIIHVPYEVINQWEDWVPLDPRTTLHFSDVFVPDEVEAIKSFHAVWEQAVAAVPDDYPALLDVQALPAWEKLRQEAEVALAVFARRGRLSEEREAH